MGWLDDIEKLINEHGSSTILRERIALANDKYAALGAKNKKLECEKADLENENERLRHDLREAHEQLEVQRITIKAIPAEQQTILLLLMKEGLTEGDVIRASSRSAAAVKFDLVELAEAGLIDCQDLYCAGIFCSLTQDGRRYLKENDLLA